MFCFKYFDMDVDMKMKKRLGYCAIFQRQFFMFHELILPLETYYSSNQTQICILILCKELSFLMISRAMSLVDPFNSSCYETDIFTAFVLVSIYVLCNLII